MARDKESLVVEHVVDVLLNDPVSSRFCIDTADRILGRPCCSANEVGDVEWWNAHNEVMIELLTAVSNQFR